MTDVLSGESVSDLFQGFLKKHSPDSFISIKFGQNGGTTLNMVAESKEVADFWVRGLRKLILNRGLFISNKRFLSMLTTYKHTAEREKNAPRRVSPFLAWGDFHARSRFARSTIPEEKWGTTRSLVIVHCKPL